MRHYLYFWLCVAGLCGAALCSFHGAAICAGACSLTALAALLLYRHATAKPMHAIRSGMDLLRSQDFASRLCKVGQKDADEVVVLFNKLMDSMKSERLKNEEQNAFLGKLIAASPMGIATCTLDGEIESSNPAFGSMTSPALLETLGTLADGEQRTVRPASGQVLRCSRMYFMDRGFRRPFFLVERLTDEIVRAETELFYKIVRTMGHEVNNTLGGVVSVLETLEGIHAGDISVLEALVSCRSSCLALRDFVKAYSDVVKLPEPVAAPLDLGKFLSSCGSFLAGMCPPNIQFVLDTGNAATVHADRMLLERVLVNAVKNAVESIGGREGRISVRASGRTLEVTDNGPGLSDEAASRVFTPFFSTKHADRGLGLMLIADVLRKHKADFTLTTASDGLTRLHIEFRDGGNQ